MTTNKDHVLWLKRRCLEALRLVNAKEAVIRKHGIYVGVIAGSPEVKNISLLQLQLEYNQFVIEYNKTILVTNPEDRLFLMQI